MPTPATPSSRGYLGVAKETTVNVPVAPTMSIPYTNVTPHDEIMLIDDVGVRGSMVALYDQVPGPRWGTMDVSGSVFPDSIPWFIGSILPDLTTTGTGPYTTTFSVKNTGTGQPTTATFAWFDNLDATSGARYYGGMQVSDLSFKWDATKELTYDAKTVCYSSALVPTAAPTKTFGTLAVTPAYLPTINIGGSPVLTVQSGDFSIKRPVTVLHSADGTAAPYTIFSGPVDVSGTLLFVGTDETELLRYLNVTKPSLDISFPSTINAGTSITLHATSVIYSPADPIVSKDYVEIQVAWRARANATDVGTSGGYSPCKITVQNALPSGTYQ